MQINGNPIDDKRVRPSMKGKRGRNPVAGGLAGIFATIPMTLIMAIGRKALPKREQHPLPPRAITVNVAQAVGVRIDGLTDKEQTAVVLTAHFAYGAACGGVYGLLSGRTKLPPTIEGAAFGLLVWGGSYLVGLPAVGLLSPATEHPPRRNGLMIVAHLVWGAALGSGTLFLARRR